MITAYFMAAVRGPDGNACEQNLIIGSQVGGWLQEHFPQVEIWIPHDHEEIIQSALQDDDVDADRVLSWCCRLAITKDIGIAYTGTCGRMTDGMKREWDALVLHERPVIAFNECNDYAIERIARIISELKW